MPKIMLEVKTRPIPIKNSILVYDDINKCWVETPKEDFLLEQENKIIDLNKQIELLNGKLEDFSKKMSQMAKIIKERVI